ncbi:MAG: hypothetical protein IPN36_12670 [Bacteroidetes bacterium]|nr:hypothetical protein [Bacteroidota bacterium]
MNYKLISADIEGGRVHAPTMGQEQFPSGRVWIFHGSNSVNLSILNDLFLGIYFLKLISGDSTTEPVS